MCGLLYLNIKNNFNFNKSDFKKALELSKYRGRDDQKIIQHKNNFFGFNRLSIVGTKDSNQPIYNDEKLLVFNGELYNFDHLNYESDSLNLFDLCNQNKINNIEGQYAFVLYDKINNTFEIFRDQFGQKPMYYVDNENFFIASSTIKSIISLYRTLTKKKLSINREALNEYLLFGYFREPETIFSEIKILQAGKSLKFNNKREISINDYLSNTKKELNNYEDFFVKTLKHSRKIKSLFLSSGIDSNYILTKLIENGIRFKIFTLKNKNNKIDESDLVIKNIKKLKIFNNLEIISSQKNDLINEIKHLSKIYELPSSDGLNLFYLLKNIKNSDNSKIFFSGIGGDEIFGGYNTFKYYNFFYFLKILKFPFKFFKKTNRFHKFKGDIFSYYTAYKADPFFVKLISISELNKIINKIKTNIKRMNNTNNNLEIIRQLEINEYMKNQLLRDADNISLYFGKEIFNPFLSSFLYSNKVDFKKSLKSKIESFGINLSKKKRGFSIEFENINIKNSDLAILKKNNDKYKIVDNNYFEEIFQNKRLIKQQIKLSILLFWLEVNLVTNSTS